ncbi:LysR family transcriptional regulator [Paracoccus seriniphilus]|uniref:DNA-binding transcriptional regulator, LysR family n=1 Tax=Paracoccus seriniphilus TaxID=184748 RepID=A0A239PVY8_9RHOB|nr:LysR family transcriptional regulator [Paracoccus seriniphilus]WCR13298.1 LysR family transcriptional regulator [Paracoccus seriniphilus]SNT74464.1 DNA-binding transcriptional regulator, LysR family [Paracoccus seriniphilus]
MDTDGLRLFVLAAEKLNISAAGRELGLAPAVAGARLAKLENAVGADLLHRSTRKVSLSLEGAEFLPYAREILAQEDAGRAALGMGQATPRGTLRFTAPSTFAQLYIAPILPDFLARYPELTLDMRLSDTVFDLIEGSFDLAIRNSALADTSLKGRKLADDNRVLCASPAYLEKHGVPRHPDDLGQHQLIAFKNQVARPLIGPHGQNMVFDPAQSGCRLIVDDGLTHKRVTMAGAGISMNSLWSVAAELASGELVQVLPDYKLADRSVIWLVYPKSNVLSLKVRVFMDFLIERIGKTPGWQRG